MSKEKQETLLPLVAVRVGRTGGVGGDDTSKLIFCAVFFDSPEPDANSCPLLEGVASTMLIEEEVELRFLSGRIRAVGSDENVKLKLFVAAFDSEPKETACDVLEDVASTMLIEEEAELRFFSVR